MFKTSLSTIVALAFAAGAATPLAAQTSATVAYNDLNLATEAGQATLDHRLEKAAREVCGTRPSVRDTKGMTVYRDCLANARDSYAEQVELAIRAAEGRRVAVLADKLAFIAMR